MVARLLTNTSPLEESNGVITVFIDVQTDGEVGRDTYIYTNRQLLLLAEPPPRVKQIYGQICEGEMALSSESLGGTNYSLDRSTKVFPANWVRQMLNQADTHGALFLPTHQTHS